MGKWEWQRKAQADDGVQGSWSRRNSRMVNRSAAIHNHSADSTHPFVKPLVLSFSTPRIAPRFPPRAFGEFIKNSRLEKGLRQVDVAKAADVDEITMGRWERASRLPRQYSKIQAVCEKLGLDYAALIERVAPARPDQTGFGATLRNARGKKGLTQKQAARLAGIDPGTLAR